MPFALNDATAFINPTKALEYMAMGKPIVATAIEDVVGQFSGVVAIGANATEFIVQARHYATQIDDERIRGGLELVKRNSWESIVRQLEGHIDDVLTTKRALGVSAA
jgi:glycosyltransferase involved in cell wall biosynthesis